MDATKAEIFFLGSIDAGKIPFPCSAVASWVAEISAPDGVGVSDPSELLQPFGDLESIISKREQLYYMFSTLPGFTVSMGGPTTVSFKWKCLSLISFYFSSKLIKR